MPEVVCYPDNKSVDLDPGQTILDGLVNGEIPITNVCGGQAYCSTCRIMLLEGIENCTEATSSELALAKKLDFPFHVRLACQTKVFQGHVKVRRLVNDDQDIDIVDHQFSSGTTGNKKAVTLLVAKIRGMTDFDEINFPYDTFYTMSRYFQFLHKIVHQYGGVINNYMDHVAIATFGMNNDHHSAEYAVWAGLEMLKSQAELNQFLEQLSYQPLNLTIGLHFAEVVLVAADPNRLDFIIPVGAAVNLSQQIEASNVRAKTSILVSESVYTQVQSKVTLGRKGSISVGDQEIKVFEPVGMSGEPPVIEQRATGESKSLLGRVANFMDRFSGKKRR